MVKRLPRLYLRRRASTKKFRDSYGSFKTPGGFFLSRVFVFLTYILFLFSFAIMAYPYLCIEPGIYSKIPYTAILLLVLGVFSYSGESKVMSNQLILANLIVVNFITCTLIFGLITGPAAVNCSPISEAVEKKELSVCDKIIGSYYRRQCYYKVVEVKGDPGSCGKISDLGYREACYSDIVGSMDNLSIIVCGRIQDPNTRGFCYYKVATTKRDSSLCLLIQDPLKKHKCVEISQ